MGKAHVKPSLQALVLAEKIYEAKNGQKIIAGTFNQLTFHTIQPQIVEDEQGGKHNIVSGGDGENAPHVYISLTDVVNNTQIELQFVSLKRNEVLFQTSLILPSKGRLQTLEIIAKLPPLKVPEAGIYAFEVVCEQEVIGSHRITILFDDTSEAAGHHTGE